MKKKDIVAPVSAAALAAAAAGAMTSGVRAQTLAGVQCTTPAQQHCGESCTPELLGNRGNVADPEAGREFFLDSRATSRGRAGGVHPEPPRRRVHRQLAAPLFPGAGLQGEYRLVVATPTAAGSGPWSEARRMWARGDRRRPPAEHRQPRDRALRPGEYPERSGSPGHSQGGMTSNRLVCTDFFGQGRRMAQPVGRPHRPSRDRAGLLRPAAAAGARAADPSASAGCRGPAGVRHLVHLRVRRARDRGAAGDVAVGARSIDARRRERRADVVDEREGYVTGACARPRRQLGLRPAAWHRGGVRVSDARGGRMVADVVRIDKGHTEGLEPEVTEALVPDDGRCAWRARSRHGTDAG